MPTRAGSAGAEGPGRSREEPRAGLIGGRVHETRWFCSGGRRRCRRGERGVRVCYRQRRVRRAALAGPFSEYTPGGLRWGLWGGVGGGVGGEGRGAGL